MIEMFSYRYMVKAFIIGIIISIIIPMIGTIVTYKKMSIIGDSLSHISLAGALFGLVFGIMPTKTALVFVVIASIIIELIRRYYPSFSDIAVAIIMSLGAAIASILSGFVKQNINIESYLFGNIINIDNSEFKFIIVVSIILFIILTLIYKKLIYISFDETSARLNNINVNFYNMLFMIMTGIIVSLYAKAIGILLISSLMIISVASSFTLKKGYKKTLLYSILFSIFFIISGLVISFYLPIKTSGTIVIIGIITLIIMILTHRKSSY